MRLGRESAVNIVLALAVALAAGWVVRNTEWVEVERPVLPRGEAAKDRHYALKRILERVGAEVRSPPNLDRLPPPHAVLVLHSFDWNLFAEREQALRRWVEGGGRLFTTQYQQPGWVPIGLQRVQRSGATATRPPPSPAGDLDADDADDAERDAPPARRPVPPRPIAACHTVREAGHLRLAYGVPREFRLCNRAGNTVIAGSKDAVVRWQLGGPEGGDIVSVGVGQGSVTSYIGELTDNHTIFEGDNALALVAALSLQRGDEVWFVDSESRTPLLRLVWQRGMPAVMLFALLIALVWWRAGARFGPPAPVPPLARRSVAEQVRGTAHFIFQRGSASLHRAQLRALEEAGRRRIRDHDRLDRRARAEAIAHATGLDREDLARAMDPTLKRPRRELLATLALLESAVRRLSPNP